ncbi:MAG: ComEC family competence protein [Rhodospirillales bacterium]|nr:ComEC family competence protein [Alphaproteobacteria bacterium]USO03311.1 MAG: ComEC family competence protein [Rhodospirillales bacterium]
MVIKHFTRQRERLFLWAPVFLGLGIVIYFALRFEPPLYVGGAGAGASLVLIALLRAEKAALFSCLGIFLIFVGIGAAQISAVRHYTPLLDKPLGPVQVEGIVYSAEPKETGKGSRVVLSDLTIEKLAPAQTPRKIRVLVRADRDIKAGDRIRFLGKLNPPAGPVAPGAFDFQRYAYFQEIGAVGFAYNAPEILARKTPFPAFAPALTFETLRARISEKVETHASAPYAAVMITLLTGQRGAVREEDKEAMRDSGLAHLLAISGLHVGMAAGAVFFFVRLLLAFFPFIALHCPIKKIAAAAALLAAVFYTFMVGAGIPAQRALMMTGLVLLAVLFDRSPFSMRLVALAAFAVLLFSPQSLVGVSFQMSFAAVASLIFFYQWIRPFWSQLYRRAGFLRRIGLYFCGVLMTTVIAGFATGLFALYHFQNFALYGVLSNMIAVPLMGVFVMPFAVLSYPLMLVGLEGPALNVMEWGVSWILATAGWTASLDGAVWKVPVWSPVSFGLFVFGGLFFMLWEGRGKIIALLPVIAGLVLLPFYAQPDILVSAKGGLVGVRGQNGKLYLSSRRAERYTGENWMRRNGRRDEIPEVWPEEGGAEGFPLTCGEQGCRGVLRGRRVSFPKTALAQKEDCGWADILISPFPVRDKECGAEIVIDRFDVAKNGAYALWLAGKSVKIRSVRDVRGQRPWTGGS